MHKSINSFFTLLTLIIFSACSSVQVTEEAVADQSVAGVSITSKSTATQAVLANAVVYFEYDRFNLTSKSIQALKGVTWDWNSNADELQQSLPNVGVIAQDVEKVLPQLVTDRDNGFKGVDYAKLTGLLIEAVKDHPNLTYLYKQLDQTQRVKPAIHEYVKPLGLTMSEEDVHPSAEGHQKYFDDILKPFLEEKNFFE